jgi:hypothetical protein
MECTKFYRQIVEAKAKYLRLCASIPKKMTTLIAQSIGGLKLVIINKSI